MNIFIFNPFRKSQLGSILWRRALSLLLASATVTTSLALIPEPHNLLYGTITLDSLPITSAMTNFVVEARRTTNGPVVASYRMGSNPQAGNFYSLEVAVESFAPVNDSSASQVGERLFIVLRDVSGIRAQTNFTIVERGQVMRMDFGSAVLDGDGDGLPDVWEMYRFGNLGQTSTNLTAGGQTVLQHFIAGTDPNDAQAGFRLHINLTNNLKRVWFVATRAEGPGYDGLARRYTLEFRPSLATGLWSDVPNYVDLLGTNQTVNFFPASSNTPGFYRARVSLSPALVLSELPRLKIESIAPGFATLSWTSVSPGWLLQEATNVTSPNWINSPSGSTNPITIPTAAAVKYYRLFKP